MKLFLQIKKNAAYLEKPKLSKEVAIKNLKSKNVFSIFLVPLTEKVPPVKYISNFWTWSKTLKTISFLYKWFSISRDVQKEVLGGSNTPLRKWAIGENLPNLFAKITINFKLYVSFEKGHFFVSSFLITFYVLLFAYWSYIFR